jgi:hypothetical protein
MDATELSRLAGKLRRDKERADASREALRQAILTALDEGMRQADVARATGYTRERLRQLANSG